MYPAMLQLVDKSFVVKVAGERMPLSQRELVLALHPPDWQHGGMRLSGRAQPHGFRPLLAHPAQLCTLTPADFNLSKVLIPAASSAGTAEGIKNPIWQASKQLGGGPMQMCSWH